MSVESSRDPRERLVREKYFSLRPKPLEHWLWSQGIPASVERVFWFHWQEGMKRGDWCSQVPIRRVAAECCLDISTVTRAYQLLARLGCLQRTDAGRDPRNPFLQATSVTEVRIPRELLLELDRHPSRLSKPACEAPRAAVTRSPKTTVSAEESATERTADPFAGQSARARLRALSGLTHRMSGTERVRYDEAVRSHLGHMCFDAESRLSAEERGRLLQHLSVLASTPSRSAQLLREPQKAHAPPQSRALSIFELARLNRDVQSLMGPAATPELVRQIVWSLEQGALKRFNTQHAIHIALKKLRANAWTRPNRMPPNWIHPAGVHAALGLCVRA